MNLLSSFVVTILLSSLGLGTSGAQDVAYAVHPAGPSRTSAAAPVRVATADFSIQNGPDASRHLVIGHTTAITSRHRFAKIYVTNPAILYAYTATPNEVLVTAKQAGISSLVVWDELGQSTSYLFSSDTDLALLRDALKEALPTEPIDVQGRESRVVLTGTVSSSAASDAAGKLAGMYSKDVSNALVVNSVSVKQVRLKVRIVEVDRSKLDQFAFNFFSAGGKNLAATTTTQFPSSLTASSAGSASSAGGSTSSVGSKTVSISNPLNFLLYASQYNIGATLQDLENRQVLQILAEPTISTMSGEKANFLAGGEFPFPVVQASSGGLASVTIQFRPYGVKLEFTPIVNGDGSIQLHVAPEVSALDYTNAVSIGGYTIPALSTRRAETQVVLRSGQSFAISGLLDKRTTDSLGKTPGIASIPVLGQLFKSKSISRSTTELIVVVTPTIVDPMTQSDVLEDPQPALPFLDQKKFDSGMPPIKQ